MTTASSSVSEQTPDPTQKQYILSATKLMKFMKEKEGCDIKFAWVYFFSKMALKIRTRGIHFYPIAIFYYTEGTDGDDVAHRFNIDVLHEVYGDDVGIRYPIGRDTDLYTYHEINMLEIEGKEATFDTSDGKQTYYPCRTIIYKSHIDVMKSLANKYRESAQQFKFRKSTNSRGDNVKGLMDLL